MNYRILALIGVRLLGIWLIVLGISVLPQLANLWRGLPVSGTYPSEFRWFLIGYTLMLIAPFILGVILWVISPWLSCLVAPARDDAPRRAATPVLVQGAIAIAGLVIGVTTLPDLIYTLVNVGYRASISHSFTVPSSYTATISWNLWATLAMQVILVLLGLGMFLGSRRLREWIYRLRTVNT